MLFVLTEEFGTTTALAVITELGANDEEEEVELGP